MEHLLGRSEGTKCMQISYSWEIGEIFSQLASGMQIEWVCGDRIGLAKREEKCHKIDDRGNKAISKNKP